MVKKYSLAIVLLLAVVLSACTMQYPQGQKPAVTPSPTSRFDSPLPGNNNMAIVESLATGTALALTAGAGGNPNANLTASPVGGTPLTPGAQDTTQTTPMTPITQITFTSTPMVGGATAIATTAVVQQPTVAAMTSTPIPQGARPGSYTLQQGEFPYCIARRFNVDPDELLALSGLSDGVIYPAGTVLRIPSSGSFPGERSLRAHPASYTVTSSDETLYSIACLFGDVDPAQIAQRNNLSLGAALTAGQVLNIP